MFSLEVVAQEDCTRQNPRAPRDFAALSKFKFFDIGFDKL